MMRKKILLIAPLILLLFSCGKEQAISDKIKGKWTISEIRFNQDSIYRAFDKEKHEIEFLGGEKAYTSTFTGIYFLDYLDASKKDIQDTFRYDIKENQLSITLVKNATVSKLLRFRYKVESYKDKDLFLNRQGIDTVMAGIRAIRND
jgi:hypothetical protein